jgi:hypothetical protein
MSEQKSYKDEIVSLLKEITGERPDAEVNKRGVHVIFRDPERLAAAGIDIKNPPSTRKANTYTFPDTIETVHALKDVLMERNIEAENKHNVETKKEPTVKYRKPKPDDFRRPRVFHSSIGDSSGPGSYSGYVRGR